MATEIYQITETEDTILIVNEVEETVVFIATERNGEDGREIELQNNGTHVQWRYVGDVSWTNIIAIADITGADGSDGVDGTDADQLELQATVTHIQWRYVGGAWTNLIALTDITGPAGTTDHNALSNLSVDSHPIYAFLAGRASGQTLIGGTGVSDMLTLQGTTGNGTLTAKALRVLVGNAGSDEVLSIKNNGHIDVAQRINFGTTTGAGRINLPDAGTTASDGIQFGTGTSNLYRNSLGNLRTDAGLYVSGRVDFNSSIFAMNTTTMQINFGGIHTFNTNSYTFAANTLLSAAATSAISITQTWNTTGSPTAIFANITDAGSGASAKLMDLQVGGVSQFRVSKGGRIDLLSGASSLYHDGIVTTYLNSGRLSFNVNRNEATDYIVWGNSGNTTITSGVATFMHLSGFGVGFAPTSGTGVYNNLLIGPTINQTGGANGVTRGLYVNPTLTAAADWRAIETNSVANSVVIGKNTGKTALEITSTTQGFLPPRMTTAQRDAIATVAGDAGLTIFNTTTTKLETWDGAVWQQAW